MAAAIMLRLGFTQQRPLRAEMICPIPGRHRKCAHRVQHAARAANAIIQFAISRDQPLRIRLVRRCGDTDEIEREQIRSPGNRTSGVRHSSVTMG